MTELYLQKWKELLASIQAFQAEYERITRRLRRIKPTRSSAYLFRIRLRAMFR